MKNDFFTYSRQKIEKDKAAGRCDVANNRGAALKCLSKFLGKEDLTFGELSPEMMTQLMVSWEIWRVRENITKALKLIATRCNLSVVPSLKMTKDIYQRAIDNISVSKII